MKNKYLLYVLTGLLVCGFIQKANAQQGEIKFANGIIVAIKVEKNGENQNSSNISTLSASDENSIHRVLIDKKNKLYAGYDLEITPTADAEQFEVLIKPLSVNQDIAGAINTIGDSNNLSLRSIPKYPGKITVKDGDTIALEVLENPQTGEKISDLIKITRKKQESGSYFSDEKMIKGFAINDVKLSIKGFEVYVNGEKVKFSGGGMIGSVLWVYFPNKGRFIFSPIEQPGYNFQKIGVIDDKQMSFDYEGTNYKLVSNSPILSSGKWYLWVMADPNYEPSEKNSSNPSLTFGAASNVDGLFDNK